MNTFSIQDRRCDACGHTHAGAEVGFICIGCPCDARPLQWAESPVDAEPAPRALTAFPVEWITVKTRGGWIDVEAVVFGPWAATRVVVSFEGAQWMSADRYRVTHVPTGLAVGAGALGDGVSLADAVAIASALSKRFSYGRPPPGADERADVEAIIESAIARSGEPPR